MQLLPSLILDPVLVFFFGDLIFTKSSNECTGVTGYQERGAKLCFGLILLTHPSLDLLGSVMDEGIGWISYEAQRQCYLQPLRNLVDPNHNNIS